MISVLYSIIIYASILTGARASEFSGFYQPKQNEAYAASWIVPKSYFIDSKSAMEKIYALESATKSVFSHVRDSLMTRDFLDFFVEHLSSTTNMIEDFKNDPFLIRQLARKTRDIKKYLRTHNHNASPLANNTIAVMPFSMHTYRPREDSRMRLLFFELTYLSVFVHVPRIVVAVPDEYHMELLQSLHIHPPFEVIKCYGDGKEPNSPKEGHDYDLMKCMMLELHSILSNSENADREDRWKPFTRVLFTECDQVLHIRVADEIDSAMTASGETLMMIPHRMNTLVLPKTFPDKDFTGVKSLDNVTLITENPVLPRGSCCDDGRYKVVNGCGNFWWACEDVYYDMDNTWLKFGSSGFPLPLATEHMAKCTYSAVKKCCALPEGCSNRIPLNGVTPCGEISKVTKVLYN